MSQSRYGNGSAGGRRISDLPEPIGKAFGPGEMNGAKTAIRTGMRLTNNIVKPKVISGLKTATSTPLRTATTLAGAATVADLAGRRRRRNQVYNGLASKAYRPEADRQRRLGAYEAGLGIAGTAGVVAGARGIRQTTRAARGAAKLTAKWKDQGTHAALRQGVTARRRDIGLVAGGTAALGGAGLVHQHATGKHGRAWN